MNREDFEEFWKRYYISTGFCHSKEEMQIAWNACAALAEKRIAELEEEIEKKTLQAIAWKSESEQNRHRAEKAEAERDRLRRALELYRGQVNIHGVESACAALKGER